jgi:hypothetical protein
MLGRLPCKALISFFAVLVMGIRTAQAHQMLYDQDGNRLAVGIEAGLGGFGVGNVDTGAGNVNTNAPFEGPFPASERRITRGWFEGFAKPFVELETRFRFQPHLCSGQVVGALTRGSGDATWFGATGRAIDHLRRPATRSPKTPLSAGIPPISLLTLQ